MSLNWDACTFATFLTIKMKYLLTILTTIFFLDNTAQSADRFYFQWGWNKETYSKSTIHFTNGDEYDLYWEKAKAHDKPDFNYILSPQITIPQFSFRLGVRIKDKWFVELNHDHAKYVVERNQIVRMYGTRNGQMVDENVELRWSEFNFEHTNGANFWMLMAAREFDSLFASPKFGAFAKAGGGLLYPRTDVTLFGKRFNNNFHIAGYLVGVEGSFRYYPFRHFYLDLSGKTGYANYTNALTVEGGKAQHSFVFLEGIFSLGVRI